MKTLQELKEERAKLTSEVRALYSKASDEKRELSDDEKKLVRETLDKAETVHVEILKREEEERNKVADTELETRLGSLETSVSDPGQRRSIPAQPAQPEGQTTREFRLPANVRPYGGFRNFKGPRAAETAYRCGMFLLAAFGSERARKFCREHDIPVVYRKEEETEQRIHTAGTASAGGYLIPDEFAATEIALREQFGVFRQYARMEPMAREVKSIPRRTGGLTAYAVGETEAATESTKAWDRVNLVAKKFAVLTRSTSEVSEDSVMNLADNLIGEIAYAFAAIEDDCGFNGDGTSTYSGIVGIRQAILNLSATREDIASLVVASGNAFSEFALGDFTTALGKLPIYADTPNAAWFCHKRFYFEVMKRLENAAGGQTQQEVQEGGGRGRYIFQGYPVVFSQKMPAVESNDTIVCVLGDLGMGVAFGDRRESTISVSDQASVGGQSLWERDEIGIKGTTRFDINVHETGDTNSTAASQNPGAIIGIATAAS